MRRRPHLLRVVGEPAPFAPLVEALAGEGARVGWLEWGGEVEPPSSLAGAAELPVLRAVAASRQRSVAVKPLRGQPVLGDLLREYFRGCRLVLVRGEIEAPSLEPSGEGWAVSTREGRRELSTLELVRALGAPSFP
jgi:hypothetical protein